jgi:RNA polymerase sigma-70 factor (ECF subfamily)
MRAESDAVGLTISSVQIGEQASDDELVTAAQHALPAFEHLYRRYVNDVYRFCLHRLDSPEDAADATSMVFTRALGGIKSCQSNSFRPWLFAIARNVVTDHYRALRPVDVLDETLEIADHQSGPEEQAISGDQRRSLVAAMRSLTEEQRSIIELRLAGMRANEIAVTLGKSRNAIDQMQYRAIARLRTLLAAPVAGLEETR